MSDERGLPLLLQEARKAYGRAIQERLQENGFPDFPRGGGGVLGGVTIFGRSQRGDLAPLDLRIASKLEAGGYVAWDGDTLTVTERGLAAGAEVNAAVEAVDDRLREAVGAETVAEVRRVLELLVDL